MKVMYNCFFSSLFLGEGSVDLEIFLFYALYDLPRNVGFVSFLRASPHCISSR